MRIAALVPGGIGEQILFFPTLSAIKTAYPQADVDVVVEPRAKGAYRVSQSASSVVPFDFKARSSPADWANLLGVLRDRYYDAVISLDRRWSMGVLLWLTGIPERIGYRSSFGNCLLTQAIPLKTEQYAAAMYHDLLQALDVTTPCPDLAIDVLRSDVDWAETERERLGLAQGGYLLIHGGSSQFSKDKGIDKTYSTEGWEAIIQEFRNRQPELPIVLVEGPDDAEEVADLIGVVSGLKVIKTEDIGKLAAMIAGASLMICTDSAPMHLAVSLQVYTVAIFGPTEPDKLLPKSDKFLGVKSPTDKISDVTPDMVLKKIFGEDE
ncbi:MAG: glycosyltransferase family 9 protein [Cyanobacteria bacterium P01_F01_bin.150]